MGKAICKHEYDCKPTNVGLAFLGMPYYFSCRKCPKSFFGNARKARKLYRKGQYYSYERNWKKQLSDFQKNPTMHAQPNMIMTPDKVEPDFWPSDGIVL